LKWDWGRINADDLFFNLFAGTVYGSPGTSGIVFTPFLRSSIPNITASLAKVVLGTTGTGSSFVAPVLKPGGADKLENKA